MVLQPCIRLDLAAQAFDGRHFGARCKRVYFVEVQNTSAKVHGELSMSCTPAGRARLDRGNTVVLAAARMMDTVPERALVERLRLSATTCASSAAPYHARQCLEHRLGDQARCPAWRDSAPVQRVLDEAPRLRRALASSRGRHLPPAHRLAEGRYLLIYSTRMTTLGSRTVQALGWVGTSVGADGVGGLSALALRLRCSVVVNFVLVLPLLLTLP